MQFAAFSNNIRFMCCLFMEIRKEVFWRVCLSGKPGVCVISGRMPRFAVAGCRDCWICWNTSKPWTSCVEMVRTAPKLFRKHTVKPKFIQTPSTFLTLSQFIHYSLENGNKIWQELRVKLFQNKFILIISDNFDRKVCNELGWIAVSCSKLTALSKKLDKTNLGQPVTKQWLILFSQWCKK